MPNTFNIISRRPLSESMHIQFLFFRSFINCFKYHSCRTDVIKASPICYIGDSFHLVMRDVCFINEWFYQVFWCNLVKAWGGSGLVGFETVWMFSEITLSFSAGPLILSRVSRLEKDICGFVAWSWEQSDICCVLRVSFRGIMCSFLVFGMRLERLGKTWRGNLWCSQLRHGLKELYE